MTDEEITGYLEDNGYPPHIVRGGKAGLVKRWREFVSEVERGYRYRLDDYRNDLDLRGVIAMLGLENEAGIADADEGLKQMLTETDCRVWESVDGSPFWDFGYPRNASGELLNDLREAGFFE
ncbi:MAG: hypothetical protein ACRD5Z_17190 [Bryobacteraceae bacterium]